MDEEKHIFTSFNTCLFFNLIIAEKGPIIEPVPMPILVKPTPQSSQPISAKIVVVNPQPEPVASKLADCSL